MTGSSSGRSQPGATTGRRRGRWGLPDFSGGPSPSCRFSLSHRRKSLSPPCHCHASCLTGGAGEKKRDRRVPPQSEIAAETPVARGLGAGVRRHRRRRRGAQSRARALALYLAARARFRRAAGRSALPAVPRRARRRCRAGRLHRDRRAPGRGRARLLDRASALGAGLCDRGGARGARRGAHARPSADRRGGTSSTILPRAGCCASSASRRPARCARGTAAGAARKRPPPNTRSTWRARRNPECARRSASPREGGGLGQMKDDQMA